MNHCRTCFNMVNGECETMTDPFNDFGCFMTKEQRIANQAELIEYCETYGTPDGVYSLKRQMKKLQERL